MIEPRQSLLRRIVMKAFGSGASTPAPESGAELRIYMIHVPGRDETERVLVGSLSSHEGRWTFQYAPAYAADKAAPSISAFPDKDKVYVSDHLWPFFDVRLPPLEREDVRKIVEREGIHEDDKLRLLGSLSRRAVTSPYEFELAAQGA